jgi:hypothetical protein
MMHRAALLGLTLVVICLSGCDRAPPGASSPGRPDPATPARVVTTTRPEQAERALGLTRRLPNTYVARCARIRSQAPADPCPPLIPVGRLKVAGPYQKRWEGYRDLDLGSASLNWIGGAPVETNGGHWTVSVAWGPTGRRVLHRTLHAIGGWWGPHPRSACAVVGLEGERVQACRVPAHEVGGGYYGGHVAYAWQRGAVVYHVTIHGYANEPRLRLMMAALIHREKRRHSR